MAPGRSGAAAARGERDTGGCHERGATQPGALLPAGAAGRWAGAHNVSFLRLTSCRQVLTFRKPNTRFGPAGVRPQPRTTGDSPLHIQSLLRIIIQEE